MRPAFPRPWDVNSFKFLPKTANDPKVDFAKSCFFVIVSKRTKMTNDRYFNYRQCDSCT